MQTFTAKADTLINTPASKVWEALIDPDMVKLWLFGTEMTADWKVGGKISYKGEWEGRSYEDKGEILELVPERLLVSTYFSGLTGLPDIPENYQKVTYRLTPVPDGTRLDIIQEGNRTEESAKHSENNWKMVIQNLKTICEK